MSNAAYSIPGHVPPDLVIDFDFRHDPQLRTDPWSVLTAMNDKPDTFFSPELGGYWVVTRGELVAEVMRRHELFSARNIGIPVVKGAPVMIPNNLDPPVHAKYRRILSQQMFSPQALGAVEEDSRRMTRELLEQFARSGECEFVEAFARPLPVLSFLQMMDLPAERLPQFMSWIRGIFHGATIEERAAGFQNAHQFLSRWLDERMTGPLPVAICLQHCSARRSTGGG
jgi:cytochrome P450